MIMNPTPMPLTKVPRPMYLRPNQNCSAKNRIFVHRFCTPSEMPSISARRIFSALMESLPR